MEFPKNKKKFFYNFICTIFTVILIGSFSVWFGQRWAGVRMVSKTTDQVLLYVVLIQVVIALIIYPFEKKIDHWLQRKI